MGVYEDLFAPEYAKRLEYGTLETAGRITLFVYKRAGDAAAVNASDWYTVDGLHVYLTKVPSPRTFPSNEGKRSYSR